MPLAVNEPKGIKLPVIPVMRAVIFPSMPYTTDLKEPFAKAGYAASGTERTVFLAFSEATDAMIPEVDNLYPTGVIARAESTVYSEQDSENPKIVFRCLCRASASLYEKTPDTIYTYAVPEEPPIEEKDGEAETGREAMRRLLLKNLGKLIAVICPERADIILQAEKTEDLGALCDYIAYSVLQTQSERLSVLAEYDVFARAELVCRIIEREIQICSKEMYIARKIQHNFEESQYDNYLREKLNVIKEELGEDEDDVDEYISGIKKMTFSSDSEVSEKIKEKLVKEASKLEKMPFGSAEASVIKGYLDTCLELPWNTYTDDCLDIERAQKILDGDHDGLEKPKERIIEYLAVKHLNPGVKNQILCFAGPPGVGKTSLGMSVARAMGRKFARVSLGGIHDEAEIRGHRKTYIGSMPGRIIEAIRTAGSCNPVLLLDEIDKMCATVQGDPASAMLEVLDAEQNKNFRDHYLEIPFDLSDCLFIATANSVSDIPSPLLDRMELIELPTYTDSEKIQIAEHHLIPKQLKRHGLTKSQLKFKRDAIAEIIDGYTREAGVRNLEREIAKICRRTAKSIVLGERGSLTVNTAAVARMLGPRRSYNEKCSGENLLGVVNGLAYTGAGGDVLKIETSVMPGDGKIKLTGSLGDVMKESAYLAVSYIRANSEALSVEKDFYKKYDIHIHVPEGATPKDGPSAGVTMLTSLTSALSRREVRGDVAMTGELTLTGRVLPIGGLREKTFAAYKAGIKTIIIPKDNVPDLEEIDKTVRENVEFKPVSRADEVLATALVPTA